MSGTNIFEIVSEHLLEVSRNVHLDCEECE